MNCQCGATPDLSLNVSSSFDLLIPVFVHPDLMDWDFMSFLIAHSLIICFGVLVLRRP